MLPHKAAPKVDAGPAPPKVISLAQSKLSSTVTVPVIQTSSTVTVPVIQTSSSSVMVIAKVATAGATGASVQPQVLKPAVIQSSSMNQTGSGRTVVITVPRPAGAQPGSLSNQLPQPGPLSNQLSPTAAPALPANIHIPPGMMLIRSDSGQLMLISQQALDQAQQRRDGGLVSKLAAPQAPVTAGSKANEKVTVIRMAAASSFPQAAVQKTAVVKVIGVAPKPALVQSASAVAEQSRRPVLHEAAAETKQEPSATYSREILENVKKCKNFLVTLIKLASSDSRSANMAVNVRGLVRSLLEGRLEPEEFTEQLYQELKTTPQPCLVPFLKKSLPAVRRLTADPQLFIQQASTSTHSSNTLSSLKQSSNAGKNSLQAVRLHGATARPWQSTVTQPQNRPASIQAAIKSERHYRETSLVKQSPHQTRFASSSGSYREDDDINDVASMAGVNLREENAKILTTIVGSVEKSCQDQPFLSPHHVLCRILHIGLALGVSDVEPDVVAMVSQATQEYLRGLLERLSQVAEHRSAALKEDSWHAQVNDVRSQLRFMEEVESLKKKKRDEEERDRLLRLAKSRSHSEDPQQLQLKQRAKELQRIEEAQLQKREANLTALAAIGPRKKRLLEQTQGQVTVLPRQTQPRVTRVLLRDLLVCMEEDPFLRHSLTLYKAML